MNSKTSEPEAVGPPVLSEGLGPASRSAPFDWEAHRHGKVIQVTFTPRPEYKGRAVLADLAHNAGTQMEVRVLWRMDEDDPYPGEYALGHADRLSGLLGRTWIASGDVTPAPNARLTAPDTAHRSDDE